MYAYQKKFVHPKLLAEQACEIETEILKRPIGYQDQYIAALGDFRLIAFEKTGIVHSHVISLDPAIKHRLNENLLLFYTGKKRAAETILSEQQENIQNKLPILSQLKQLAISAVEELQKGDIDCIGHMLNESWNLKKQLASGISNNSIDDFYTKAINSGALGGKLTGAGGGGFLLIYCPYGKRDLVRNALHELREIPIRLEESGSKIIFDYRS